MTHQREQQTGAELAVSWQIKDALQLKVLQMYPPPSHLFAVVSWGSAATKWLCNALNSHPDIFCVHAARTHWSYVAGPQTMTDLDYLRIIAALGSGCVAAGEVHGICRESIAAIKQTLGEGFRAIVAVRAPLARLLSFMALGRRFDFSPQQDLSYLRDLDGFRRVRHLITDREREYFAHGVNLLNAVTAERAVGPIFRAEDFTGNPSVLAELCREISGGAVVLEPAEAERMIARKPSNAHTPEGATVGEKKCLAAWQEEILQSMLLDEAKSIYQQLGYADFGG